MLFIFEFLGQSLNENFELSAIIDVTCNRVAFLLSAGVLGAIRGYGCEVFGIVQGGTFLYA